MNRFPTCMSTYTLIAKSLFLTHAVRIATVLTHLSATAWGGFQIYNTNAFHTDFKRLTTDGVCQINLLPKYWTSRAHAEIPSLAFNILALLVSSFLSFRLIKVLSDQDFFFKQEHLMFTRFSSCSGGKPSSVWAPPGRSTGYTSLS